MNFEVQLKSLVNDALAKGVTPGAVVLVLELTKHELAAKIIAVQAAEQARVLAARIVPPNGR